MMNDINSPLDKARLLMLYIISKEGGIFDEDRKKLLEHARLPRDLREAINNLTILGVKLTRLQRKAGEKSLRKRIQRRKSSKDQEQPYELSRYVNTVKKVMEVRMGLQLNTEKEGGEGTGIDYIVYFWRHRDSLFIVGKYYRYHGCRSIPLYSAI